MVGDRLSDLEAAEGNRLRFCVVRLWPCACGRNYQSGLVKLDRFADLLQYA
jgi:phosphoglycolate phosphatase-like HAD superfamily hydrolase